MLKLLSFELHKMFRTKSFYIWTIVSVILSNIFLLATFGMAQLKNSNMQSVFTPESGTISVVKFFALSPIAFCVLMFVSNFICNDFENGILKNVISKGYSRKSVFTAKYAGVFISTIIMTIVSAGTIFIFSALLYHNIGTASISFIIQILVLVLGIAVFGELYFMFCVLFRKSAPAIALSIVSLLGVSTGIQVVQNALKLKNIDLSSIWLGGAIENLAVTNPSVQVFTASLVCILIYLVAAYIVSVQSVKKTEV